MRRRSQVARSFGADALDTDAAAVTATPENLTEEPDARCVAGCYRCCCRTTIKPNHEPIDRTIGRVAAKRFSARRRYDSVLLLEPRR
jgi:hypothetical protein